MSVTDFQQWMGVAKELGYEGDDLKKFVNDRQVEAREERARQREEEKERRLMEEKKESELRQMEMEKEKRRMEEEKEKRLMEEEKEKRHLEERKESETRHMEFEIKKLESEVRLKEVEENKTTKEGDMQPTSSEYRGKGAPNIKFPMFRDNDDCLDGYLIRFERTAEAFEIPKQLWSLTLARYLEGQALQVYQRLTPAEAKDYDCLKEQLLKRFRLTEG